MKAASPDSTTNIKNIRSRFNIGKLSEVLDELKLGSFFCFISANPIAVMNMLAPEGAIERAYDIVVLNDSLLIVRSRRVTPPRNSQEAITLPAPASRYSAMRDLH